MRDLSNSWVALSAELLSAKLLVWTARRGRDVELTPGAHLYFFDRYHRLAALHRARGRAERARQLEAKADLHYRLAGGDEGPPYAAAMAMPRPGRFVRTAAVARPSFHDPDDAA